MGRSRSALLGLLLVPAFVFGTTASLQVPAAGSGTPELSRLLGLAADYCDRLARGSIDFVCLEEVSETIYEKTPQYPTSSYGRPSWRDQVLQHKFLYDYQFVVENGRKTEKRRILELDGIKKKGEETDLDTLTFFYKNVLFGAVDLLAGSRQGFYRYEIKGRESLGGRPALAVDAVPAPGLNVPVNRGTVWLREDDGAILKIVWDVTSMGDTAAIRKAAEEYKGTPQILQVTEFGIEKNGVRFPDRFHVEEVYIGKKGKRQVRSVLDAVYRDYRFFTVEVETSGIKRP
jgi:hypothetical protein